MKTVGPFVAARALDTPSKHGAARPVVTLHALDRLTGMPALVYLLPQAVALPDLPDTPSLLPYAEAGVQHGQAYVSCELPPHAAQARDPLQTALGGLRALNALHEAGLIHGGVGPSQLWEWNGDVRLGGAGLPWGEAQGALAAPEGGVSSAADLYALGVTLLRMGPLPAGLSDLLSPYPAQRPSARDALARFNAGPPLPPERTPLIVEAPLHPRAAEVAVPAPPTPLPLVADPDAHEHEVAGAPSVSPDLSIPGQGGSDQGGSAPTPHNDSGQTGPLPTKPAPTKPVQAVNLDVLAVAPASSDAPAAETARGGSAPLLDWDEVQPNEAASANAAPEASALLPEASALPPEASALPPEAVLPEVAAVSLLKPAARRPESPPVFAAALPLTDAPPTDTKVSEAEPVAASALLADPPTAHPTTPDSAASPLGRNTAPRRLSPRQLKPVKIGWSQDGSWKAVKEGQGGAADSSAQSLFGQSLFGQSGARRAVNPLWLIGAAVVLLVTLLIGRLVNRPALAVTVPGCCTVTSQLVGSSGEALSAPVNINLVSAPAGSQLQAGALVGQAPGAVKLDTPGVYTLSVAADGYAAQQVELTVPTPEPLKITLK
ncbi:hypothetical protein [Deinococcus sp.]|uniref:hypothetical protein n=1 Tax=Deinococcus sp. TaxID=47478 RepID=UPI0025EDBF08|nr:hypothetical protein [Deinococcus sp.]